MELDDLKKQWKVSTSSPLNDKIKEAIEKKMSSVERSGRGIRKMFYIEMAIIGLIYIVFFYMVWAFYDAMMTYMYKMVIAVTIPSIPIVWKLYRSQRWAATIDYTVDVRSNMLAFVTYFKGALRLYELTMYVTVVLVLILLWTDRGFVELDWRIQAMVATWMIVSSAIIRPYIKIVYGKKLQAFEDFLKE